MKKASIAVENDIHIVQLHAPAIIGGRCFEAGAVITVTPADARVLQAMNGATRVIKQPEETKYVSSDSPVHD